MTILVASFGLSPPLALPTSGIGHSSRSRIFRQALFASFLLSFCFIVLPFCFLFAF
jgi:hypothetical protein